MTMARFAFGRLWRRTLPALLAAATVAILPALPAHAAEAGIDGRDLSILWTLPFAGILLSIALMPLFLAGFWHHHYGKVAAFWALCVILPFIAIEGAGLTVHTLLETALPDYIPDRKSVV